MKSWIFIKSAQSHPCLQIVIAWKCQNELIHNFLCVAGGHGILGFTLVIPQNHPCLELLPGSGLALSLPHSSVTQSSLHTHPKSQNPTEPQDGRAWKVPLELILSNLPAQAGSCGQMTSKYPQGRRHPTGPVVRGSGKTYTQHLGENEGGEFASESTFPIFSVTK